MSDAEKLAAIKSLCDNAEAICSRTGDMADSTCHALGCAEFIVNRDDIREILGG